MRYDFDTLIDRFNTGSSKWSKYGSDILPMWVADMDFAVAPEIVAAISQRLHHPVLGYCVARPELREQIVADMAAKYDWAITPDDIVFLPGVEPGFNMAIKALLAPAQVLGIQTPIYRPILMAPGHWELAKVMFRVNQPLAEQRETLALADAILLCNPHNPTGKVYDREDLVALVESTGGKPLISDEIHCELLFDGRRHIPIASLDTEVAQRTITLMSAGKTFNIPGLKTAFAIVQNRALRDRFNGARLGMVDSVNILGLEATLAAFRDAGQWRQDVVTYLECNRDFLVDAVARRLPGVQLMAPEATYLAWLDCSNLELDDPQAHFLKNAKVGLSAGSDFGAGYGQFVRLNFGCTRKTLEEAIDRMSDCLGS